MDGEGALDEEAIPRAAKDPPVGAAPHVPEVLPPLVEAKLAAPGVRRGIVARPRVVHALDAGADATLTLVAAPLRAFGLHLGTAVDGRDATSLDGSDHTLP